MRSLHVPLLLLVICGSALAQSTLPFGPTNIGREFWVSFPANWEYAAARKYVRLYMTSSVRTRVAVYAGSTLLDSGYTVPNDLRTVDIDQLLAQVFVRDDASPIPPDSLYANTAIHIIADDPIVVYGINRTTATSDGMTLLPVAALGHEYVVASARDVADGTIQKLPSQYMVIAPFDSTTVTLVNPMDSPNHKAGESFTVTMNRGDVFSSMSVGFHGDLSGALIRADKPVAVTAGENCTYLPDERYPACDHICEMLFPVSAWGRYFKSVPYQGHIKGDLYRIFAGADGADIFINGVKIGTLPKKGGEAGVGFLEYLPPQRGAIDFSSNKPIMVAQYNNSNTYDNSTQSDPFVALLVPVEQYQREALFTTPSADFPQNFANIVCDSATLSSIEISKGSNGTWERLVANYGPDHITFPTAVNGMTYVGKAFSISPGTYRMRGPRPFSATIYGFGSYDSYGYPLAAMMANLTFSDTVSPSMRADVDCRGHAAGVVNDLPDDPAGRSNLSSIDLDPLASYNYRLDVVPFKPGDDREASYQLTVIDPSRSAVALVVASDMRGNITRDTITFNGGPLVSGQGTIDFATVPVGTKETRSATIRNLGSAPLTIDSLVLMYDNRGFRILLPPLPVTLETTESLVVPIEFEATSTASTYDSLAIVTYCGNLYVSRLTAGGTLSVEVGATGLTGLSITPNPSRDEALLDFSLDRRSDLDASLFDLNGALVRHIVDHRTLEPGRHTLRIDLSGLPAGLYPLRLRIAGQVLVAPTLVVR